MNHSITSQTAGPPRPARAATLRCGPTSTPREALWSQQGLRCPEPTPLEAWPVETRMRSTNNDDERAHSLTATPPKVTPFAPNSPIWTNGRELNCLSPSLTPDARPRPHCVARRMARRPQPRQRRGAVIKKMASSPRPGGQSYPGSSGPHCHSAAHPSPGGWAFLHRPRFGPLPPPGPRRAARRCGHRHRCPSRRPRCRPR